MYLLPDCMSLICCCLPFSLQKQPPTKTNAPAAAKPTKYHYYPHNQHIYLLPECATQQVMNYHDRMRSFIRRDDRALGATRSLLIDVHHRRSVRDSEYWSTFLCSLYHPRILNRSVMPSTCASTTPSRYVPVRSGKWLTMFSRIDWMDQQCGIVTYM